jgi:cobaltochelatase CobN
VVANVILYERYLGPTKVAFINFRDFQIARIAGFNDSSFISVNRIVLSKETDLDGLHAYDAVYIFGMGVHFSPSQRAAIRKAIKAGVSVYVHLATSKDSDLTNLNGRDHDYVAGYLRNKGRDNYRALLNYTRRVLDGKRLFTEPIKAPLKMPKDYLFDPMLSGAARIFTTVEAYERHRKATGRSPAAGPRVALLVSNVTPMNASQSHLRALVKELEARDLVVYPIAGFVKRLALLRALAPDVVVYFPHGKLSFGRGKKVMRWLQQRNIPVLTPLVIFGPKREWERSPNGMHGGMLSQNIRSP